MFSFGDPDAELIDLIEDRFSFSFGAEADSEIEEFIFKLLNFAAEFFGDKGETSVEVSIGLPLFAEGEDFGEEREGTFGDRMGARGRLDDSSLEASDRFRHFSGVELELDEMPPFGSELIELSFDFRRGIFGDDEFVFAGVHARLNTAPEKKFLFF